eukprot:scaffold670024_cov46-Prasinocladus_malaysianus.AAC.1
MAQLIRSCWHDDPQQRPTCQQVLRKLEFMLLSELQGGAMTVMPAAAPVAALDMDAKLDAGFDPLAKYAEELYDEESHGEGHSGTTGETCFNWSPALSFD